jgi:hypothetical protein
MLGWPIVPGRWLIWFGQLLPSGTKSSLFDVGVGEGGVMWS